MEADSGAIGGDVSHEFMVLASSGESVVYCENCEYAATLKKLKPLPPKYIFNKSARRLKL